MFLRENDSHEKNKTRRLYCSFSIVCLFIVSINITIVNRSIDGCLDEQLCHILYKTTDRMRTIKK